MGTATSSVWSPALHDALPISFTFTVRADDGVRVWVDGALLVDAWRDQAPTTYQHDRTLTAGDHQVKVEYYENTGGAVAQVSWAQSEGGSTCPTGQYLAQYYAA